MLELNDVSKTYRVGTFGGQLLHAVRHVSFDIRDGEVVSLIGESGSGKTTIGRMILKLSSISSGKIEYNGTDISTIHKSNLKDYYREVQGCSRIPSAHATPSSKPTAFSRSCTRNSIRT
jgi:peptide/nickel transport system ATP-binding protein